MPEKIKDIKRLQGELRIRLLRMYKKANAGHIGCSLSCIDILIACFFSLKEKGDDVILSKGHAAAALYVCLNHTGEISDSELDTFYLNGTKLPAHPAPGAFESIPFATGSLGHGFPVASGMAKAKKLKGESEKVFVVMSDGETNEGTTWEAAHFAVKHNLDNLVVIVDKNNLQGFGRTEDVLGDTTPESAWKNLGFETATADGHNVGEMISKISGMLSSGNRKPKVLIAQTVKGKGISFMEDKLEWHYLPMTDEQFELSQNEIRSAYFNG